MSDNNMDAAARARAELEALLEVDTLDSEDIFVSKSEKSEPKGEPAPSPKGEVYVPSARKLREGAAAIEAIAPKAVPTRTLDEVKALRKELMDKVAGSKDADALATMLVPELDLATRGDDVKQLRTAVKKAVQDKLKELNGAKPTAADMRDMFPELAKPKFKGTHVAMTHYAVAQRVAGETAGDLRYNIDGQDWLSWDGCRWTTLRGAQVQGIARQTINGMKADAAKLPDVDLEKLEHADSDAFRRGVVGEMVATNGMHVEQSDLDQHARYLACGNGAIDLETGKLVCKRDLLVTIKNDTVFNPAAKAPLFLKLLSEVFEGRADDIEYYELIMGYSLQANPSERAMFFHKGEGTNGKSLLLGAIMKAVGDYAVNTNYRLIADGPGTTLNGSADGPSPSLHRLMAKRIAYIDEIPVGGSLRDADVKKLAGGAGTLDARALGKDTVEFPITFVFHIACNTWAAVRNGQSATFKRAFPVIYTKQFDSVEDSTLAEKLDAEREGILAWLVRCSAKYQAMRADRKQLRDFMPATARAALDSMKEEQSPFTNWLEANCVIEPEGFLPSEEGWDNYIAYEKRTNTEWMKVSARSVPRFVKLMKDTKRFTHATQVGKARQSGFYGLRLKTDVATSLDAATTVVTTPVAPPVGPFPTKDLPF